MGLRGHDRAPHAACQPAHNLCYSSHQCLATWRFGLLNDAPIYESNPCDEPRIAAPNDGGHGRVEVGLDEL
jgi:hypothetical protein